MLEIENADRLSRQTVARDQHICERTVDEITPASVGLAVDHLRASNFSRLDSIAGHASRSVQIGDALGLEPDHLMGVGWRVGRFPAIIVR